jgi:hypothetical protein
MPIEEVRRLLLRLSEDLTLSAARVADIVETAMTFASTKH